MNDDRKSIKALREEMAVLDSQIESSKALRKILEEERKPIHSVYKWEAPERVFEQKDKKWYLMVSSFSLFIIVLSLLTENFGLIIAVIALIILLYALNSVVPGTLKHELTNKGISINSVLYPWKKVDQFWISKRGEHRFLNLTIDSTEGSDDQIISYLGKESDVKKIVSYTSQFVDYIAETDTNNNFLSKRLFGVVEPFSSFID